MRSARKPLGRIVVVAMVALTLGLNSCSSGPKIFTNENPTADFASYATYNFASRLGTDDRNGYRSILSNHLMAAADREMQARGYQRSDNPDLVVNFYVHRVEKIRTTSSPSRGGYYGYRGGHYGTYRGYDTRVTQYTEGTLNIDVVDNKSDQLAWEGIAIGRVNDKVRNNLVAAVNSVVNDIFGNYNYTAAGFVPAGPAE